MYESHLSFLDVCAKADIRHSINQQLTETITFHLGVYKERNEET